MAPEGVGAVIKMKTYSTGVGGQPGFLLIDADVYLQYSNTNFDGNDPW